MPDGDKLKTCLRPSCAEVVAPCDVQHSPSTTALLAATKGRATSGATRLRDGDVLPVAESWVPRRIPARQAQPAAPVGTNALWHSFASGPARLQRPTAVVRPPRSLPGRRTVSSRMARWLGVTVGCAQPLPCVASWEYAVQVCEADEAPSCMLDEGCREMIRVLQFGGIP